MHELSVTQGILTIALEAAQQAGARRIITIDLVIGELTSFVDDSIQFYFDALSRDTLAEHAILRFRRLPASATCQQCGQNWPVTPPLPANCPACSSSNIHITGSRELYVESIEVDNENISGT